MALRRFLGLGDETHVGRQPDDEPETATVRRIVRELEQVEPDRRRYLAGFAYMLSRAAQADLTITDEETRLMEQIVTDIGGLPPAQSVLVVEIAKNQSELYGGTEDFLVTREFAERTTPEQRRAAVEACFAIVAVDHAITTEEYAELTEIAHELNITREELNEIRGEYRDHLVAIQRMRGLEPPG